MSIKLHGNPLSPAARRAAVSLEEKALRYEFVLVDLATGQQKKEPFISLCPFGQVPGFEDGDLKLFDSRGVTRYIADAYANKGTPLMPNDPKKRGIVYVWCEVESGRFDVAGSSLSFELVTKPIMGMAPDEGVVEKNQEALGKVLDVYEARLKVSKYLGGDEFSLADLHHIPIVSNLFGTKVKALFDARPNVSKWCNDIVGRPAWKKVLEAMKF